MTNEVGGKPGNCNIPEDKWKKKMFKDREHEGLGYVLLESHMTRELTLRFGNSAEVSRE